MASWETTLAYLYWTSVLALSLYVSLYINVFHSFQLY